MNSCDRALVRVAGVSGAIAVVMGAYGAHVFRQKQRPEEFKVVKAYETGNRYHLIHSAVLLAAPLTRRPQLVGGLLIGGMLLFSGGCYIYSLTDNQCIRKVTPFGGLMLIAAWVCMAL
ncbi:hypothetical protein HELRODRAFT_87652 [Helobdella robusta]|uniref:Transmembrane protein 256 homolog n=1 Tax=Helobdella robusta TaxID=6412 RepID=T1G6T8_HELRO|nr:hypothetical protein HELRODRAFT_87652 [Helobdella robusta]ESN94754.1 hypothetical protein HELRODRAFT_87652 [Helobdella robusta]